MGSRESGSWFRARGCRVKSKNPGEPHPKVKKTLVLPDSYHTFLWLHKDDTGI